MNGYRLGCVLMAAGEGRRFGGGKLCAVLDGKTLLQRALETIPAQLFERVVVVTRGAEQMALVHGAGFIPVENRQPELGLSHTIALGLGQLTDMDAVLFQVADQPLLRRESVERLIAAQAQQPQRPAALSCGGARGNPCLFPARFFPELLALSGDRGGSAVLRRHEAELLLVEADAPELTDVDTPQVLETLRRSVHGNE